MTTLQQMKEELYQRIAAHVRANPDEPFESVGERFRVSAATVSRIAAKATRSLRKPGRKPKERAATGVSCNV